MKASWRYTKVLTPPLLFPLLTFLDLLSHVGMAAPLIGIGAVNALLFAANSQFRKLLQDHPGQVLSIGQIGLAGAGAGTRKTEVEEV